MAPQEAHVLDVQDLVVEFPRGRRRPPLRAVDRVTFSVGSQETIGLVGESGSGKTTIGRAVLGLVPVTRGRISFCGSDITRADARRRRELSAELQVVFQDPFGSLNPTRTIGQTLTEPLRVHTSLSRAEANIRAAEMLERVGLAPDAVARYPSAFSGGQRQRVAIARALMVNPRLVICDEPVSALDLSVQAQILNLLRELQSTLRLSYLFIAHDLEVVRNLSHRVLVLYRGHVVEEGQVEHVYNRPAHPYTRALLDASPSPDPDVQRFRHRQRAATHSASQASADCGCPFAPRCQYAVEICLTTRPAVEPTPSGTSVACHRWPELPPHGVDGSLKPRAAGIR